jgi:hypothetical protein
MERDINGVHVMATRRAVGLALACFLLPRRVLIQFGGSCYFCCLNRPMRGRDDPSRSTGLPKLTRPHVMSSCPISAVPQDVGVISAEHLYQRLSIICCLLFCAINLSVIVLKDGRC